MAPTLSHARGAETATRGRPLGSAEDETGDGRSPLVEDDPPNVASQRVAEKAGYAGEGVLRSCVHFADTGVDDADLAPADERCLCAEHGELVFRDRLPAGETTLFPHDRTRVTP